MRLENKTTDRHEEDGVAAFQRLRHLGVPRQEEERREEEWGEQDHPGAPEHRDEVIQRILCEIFLLQAISYRFTPSNHLLLYVTSRYTV